MTEQEATRLNQFAQLALSTRETVIASYQMTTDVLARRIPGDLVECGVFAGAQVAAMALACERANDPRPIHLYDSFCGIPKAGPFDGDDFSALVGRGDGRLETSGVSACSAQQVRGYLKGWGFDLEQFVFHAGWFQDTLPQGAPERISVLRLDGDLYESTRVCLEHLFPRVSHGGFLIVDDYALVGCRRACDEFFRDSPMRFHPIVGGTGPVYAEAL